MAEPKVIRIDSFSEEDRKDLFALICKKIAFKSQLEVIRETFKLPFHHSVTKNGFTPTISELFQVIDTYKIPYLLDLKLMYTEIEKPVEKIVSEMKKQNEKITNPELKEVVKPKIISYKEAVKIKIDPDKIPNIEL